MIDISLLVLLMVLAVAILRLRSLFGGAMLFGIYSLLSAALFVALDAVDVAFTEAAVGAGIATILILGTLSITGAKQEVVHTRSRTAVLITLLVGAGLFYASLDMPRLGDPDAPAHRHVAPRYIQESGKEIGIPNVVTSVLASYRGYDTLGEVTVIFTAGIGVLCLLGGRRRKPNRDS